jgi:hypothetical protein
MAYDTAVQYDEDLTDLTPAGKPKGKIPVDVDGNVMVIIGKSRRALRHTGHTDAEIEAYSADAMSGDYDHALQATMRWVRFVTE